MMLLVGFGLMTGAVSLKPNHAPARTSSLLKPRFGRQRLQQSADTSAPHPPD
jgi:hypothetical protein